MVSDGELQDTEAFQIAVANVAPVVTAPADQTATRDQLVQIELGSFSDTGTNAGDWDVTVDWATARRPSRSRSPRRARSARGHTPSRPRPSAP